MAVLQGPSGPRGERGLQGLVGPRGNKGDQGPPGRDGATGPRGLQGPQGVQGLQGPVGGRGPTGPQGRDGSIANIEHNVPPPDVAVVSVAGTSLLAAAANHQHKGVHGLRSNTNAYLFGDVTLDEGSGVTLSQVGNVITISAAALSPTGPAGGDLSGFYPNPQVTKITEASGPTQLGIGAISSGQILSRSGANIIGISTASLATAVNVDGITVGSTRLNALDSSLMNEGQVVYVKNVGAPFILEQVARTPDNITVVTAFNKPGYVWLRVDGVSGRWWEQLTWHVKPITGNDENDGATAGTAIKTFAELKRRMFLRFVPSALTNSVTVTLYEDAPSTDYFQTWTAISLRGGSSSIALAGSPTVAASGTVASVISRNMATNTPDQITITAFNWAPHVGKIIRKQGSSGVTQTAVIVKDLGSGSAIIEYQLGATPYVVTDVVEILTLPKLSGANIGPGFNFTFINFIDFSTANGAVTNTSAGAVNFLSCHFGETFFCKSPSGSTAGFIFAGCSIHGTTVNVDGPSAGQCLALVNGILTTLQGNVGRNEYQDIILQGTSRLDVGEQMYVRVHQVGIFDLPAGLPAFILKSFSTVEGTDLWYGSGNDVTSYIAQLDEGNQLITGGKLTFVLTGTQGFLVKPAAWSTTVAVASLPYGPDENGTRIVNNFTGDPAPNTRYIMQAAVTGIKGQSLGTIGTGYVKNSAVGGVGTLSTQATPIPGSDVSLASGAFGFGSVGNTLTGDAANAHWDSVNLRAGFRTSAPAYQLHLVDQAGASDRGLALGTHAVIDVGGSILFRKSRGNFASPAAVTSTDYAGIVGWDLYDGASYLRTAQIGVHVSPNPTISTGNVSTDMWLHVSATATGVDPYAGGGAIAAIRLRNKAGVGRRMFGLNALADVDAATTPFSNYFAGVTLLGSGTDGAFNAGNIGASTVTLTSGGAMTMFTNSSVNEFADSVFNFVRSRGTNAAPTAVRGGDRLGEIRWWSHDGTAYTLSGAIGFIPNVDATIATTDVPADFVVIPERGGNVLGLPPLMVCDSYDVLVGDFSQLTTASTGGFFRLTSTAGAPTGAPTTIRFSSAAGGTSTHTPMVSDTLHARVYAYYGHWAPVAQDTTAMVSGYLKNTTSTGVWSSVATIPYTDITGAPAAITALTGDGTASGPGSAALTLATVNSNVGSFANASITVNGKGLITAASSGPTPALASRNLIAGAGLTGGGDLTADRTFNVVANADGTIVVNANDIQAGVMQTANIANDAVTYAQMQNVSTASRLLGRGSAGGAGDVEEITIGAGLSLSGTVLSVSGTVTNVTATLPLTSSHGATPDIALNFDGTSLTLASATTLQRAALTGDVTATAGSNNTTLANIPNDVAMAGDLLAAAIVAPATPGASHARIYVDSTSKNLAVKDDAGIIKHGVQTAAAVTHQFVTAISDAGVVSLAQPAVGDVTGAAASATTITAGTGLTGGGDLSANRSFNVGQNADNSITVNADDIQLGSYALVSRATNAGPNTVNLGALTSGVLQHTVAGSISTPVVFAAGSTRVPFGSGSNGQLTDSANFTFDGAGLNDTLSITSTNATSGGLYFRNNQASGQAVLYVDNDRGSFASYGGLLNGSSANAIGNLFGLTRADRVFLFSDGASNVGLAVGTLNTTDLTLGTNNLTRLVVGSGGDWAHYKTTGTNFERVRAVFGAHPLALNAWQLLSEKGPSGAQQNIVLDAGTGLTVVTGANAQLIGQTGTNFAGFNVITAVGSEQASVTTTISRDSSAGMILDAFQINTNAFITGTTHVTTATGVNAIHVHRPDYDGNGSSKTIDIGASFYVQNAPNGHNGVTITTPLALWVDDGEARLDGRVTAGADININGSNPATNTAITVGHTNNADRDHVSFFLGGGANYDSANAFFDLFVSDTAVTGALGVWASQRIRGYTLSASTGSPSVTEASSLYIDNAPTLAGVTGSSYALHVANGTAKLSGDASVAGSGKNLGFFAISPQPRQTVSGSRSSGAALLALISALESYGLIIDGTTA